MNCLTREERETVIRWDQTPELVSIYTCDEGLMAKLESRGFRADKQSVNEGCVVAKEFNVPKSAVSFRVKTPRTERQRQASIEAGKRFAGAKKVLSDSDLGEALA